MPLPLFKKVYSDPTTNIAPTFTTFETDPTPAPFMTNIVGYNKVAVTSSSQVDFSKVTGDVLSWLMMKAEEHQYKEMPLGFLENLSEAERFLYEIFR